MKSGIKVPQPHGRAQDWLAPERAQHGEPDRFAAVYTDPARLELFLGAMTGISLPTLRAIATAFPWGEYKTFADVGCAQGGLPVEIARAHTAAR